jgi:uncharacterized protein YggU (UPF0235/DUF167 family)
MEPLKLTTYGSTTAAGQTYPYSACTAGRKANGSGSFARGALKIKLAAAPAEGSCKPALAAFLAEVFGALPRQVMLKQGNKPCRK